MSELINVTISRVNNGFFVKMSNELMALKAETFVAETADTLAKVIAEWAKGFDPPAEIMGATADQHMAVVTAAAHFAGWDGPGVYETDDGRFISLPSAAAARGRRLNRLIVQGGDWFGWNGAGGLPPQCHPGAIIEIIRRSDTPEMIPTRGQASDFTWGHGSSPMDIVAYRIA